MLSRTDTDSNKVKLFEKKQNLRESGMISFTKLWDKIIRKHTLVLFHGVITSKLTELTKCDY